jgi:hypothetical protein
MNPSTIPYQNDLAGNLPQQVLQKADDCLTIKRAASDLSH